LQEPGNGHKQLLLVKQDAKLEVAGPAMFVGRRRELQQALRVLAGRERTGVLLHGMGRLGKSSLATRLVDRRPDLTLAVVFGDYSALGVVSALDRVLKEHAPAHEMLEAGRAKVRDGGAAALQTLLIALLAGPCAGTRPGDKPLLLLVDDLEQVLDPDPAGGRHQVKTAMPEERAVLAALLQAFEPRRSQSRLLLT
ncbi:ATP-binding protein, partial [Paracraurococcus ruber]